jgi:hypothetical protein
MKIAIFDLQHFEMLHVIHNIFDDPEYEITFFTKNKVHTKIQNSVLDDRQYETLILENFDTREEFYKTCKNYIIQEQVEAIHLNTIDQDYKLVWNLIKTLDIPITLTIHNINTWLRPPFTLNKIALKNYYYRYKILSKSKAIILQEELFINYIKTHNLYKKEVSIIPHTLKTKDYHHKANEHLRIAIPGTIDGNNRRNYRFALSAIEKINHLKPNIKFVFIGGIVSSEGNKIFQLINKLINKGCNIEHKFNPNSNQIFDHEMSICDVVFMPVNINFKYEGITEIYGRTKVTGVLYDMMRFQKPGIIPTEHVVPPTMKSSIITYSTEQDFITTILDLENNKPQLSQLIKNASENAEYYSKKSIKSRFLPWYKELIP